MMPEGRKSGARGDEQVSAAMDTQVIIEELLRKMFFIRSV
jgi:hypothetical protein